MWKKAKINTFGLVKRQFVDCAPGCNTIEIRLESDQICSSLDSGLLATAVEVSKLCHNSTIKPLIQNSPISFQDNTALSLHCKFWALIFGDHGENANNYLAEWLTHLLTYKQTHTATTVHVCLWGSTHRGIIRLCCHAFNNCCYAVLVLAFCLGMCLY